MQQTIIALSGRKGSGKNTLAEFILSWYCRLSHRPINFRAAVLADYTFECSFADSLKEFCIDTLGLDHNQCYGSDEEKSIPSKYRWENVPNFYRWKFSDDELAKELVAMGARPNRMMEIFFDAKFLSKPYGLKRGFMTGRDIMQIFGTDLIRQTFGNVWADATIRKIKKMGKAISVITDKRFPNEILTVLS